MLPDGVKSSIRLYLQMTQSHTLLYHEIKNRINYKKDLNKLVTWENYEKCTNRQFICDIECGGKISKLDLSLGPQQMF